MAGNKAILFPCRFLFLGIIAPLTTGTLMSMGRYVMGLFPIYIAIGSMICRKESEVAWLIASTAFLVLMAALFARGLNIAGA